MVISKEKEDVFQSYVKWAGEKEWTVFFTLTFGKRHSLASAHKQLKLLVAAISANEQTNPSFYYSLEPHKAGGYHVHGVANQVNDLIFCRWWWKKHYGKCTFRPFDKEQQGLQYITKALFNGGEVDMAGPDWKKKTNISA